MNRLGNATSPYLQQHADNPVDWYEWGDEAFQVARARDLPILLSVGYATCHWCHVMAHESFEDAATAAYMNAHFVNVKVDREQRPDVDAVYMRAVQAMTGAGGWPMTVFLTPDRRPFYAGTYFPPRDAYGMPSFRTVLASVANAWTDRRDQILGNAEALTDHVRAMSAARPSEGAALPADLVRRGTENARRHFDARHGGFGSAPKFPAPTFLTYLLTQADGRDMAVRTLDAMMRGGLMDQLGGGFHRYSVDERWLVPHFEKMLYDNAQLARAYLRAHVVTGRADFLDTARATLAYMERELLTPEGGFACAQDADQEGIEGKFFVWTPQEFQDLLGGDADLVMRRYGVSEPGNFQDPHHPEFGRRSVLSVVNGVPELAREFGLSEDDVRARLARARETLFDARTTRAHPGLDDKVLMSWNGLALTAFADAYRLTGEVHYLNVARRNADFVRARLTAPDGAPFHAYRAGRADVRGLLEDAALYGLGLVALYAAGGDLTHLSWARDLWDRARREHWDEQAGVFYSSGPDAEALVAPTVETFDAAIMSDNAAACLLGLHMDRYFGTDDGARVTERVLSGVATDLLAHPSGFGGLWQAHALLHAPHVEVAILGTPEQRAPFERELARQDLPFVTVAPAERAGGLPLLEDRDGAGVAYLCRNFACELPARDPEAFARQLQTLTAV